MFKHMTARVRALTPWLRDESGTATVEAVLWMPIYGAFIAFVADVSLVFNYHAQVMRITQDANRMWSMGRLADRAATEKYIIDILVASNMAVTPDVNSKLSDQGVIGTSVVIPIGEVPTIMDWGSVVSDVDIKVAAFHLIEYQIGM